MIQIFMGYPLETCTDTSDSSCFQDFDRFCSLHKGPTSKLDSLPRNRTYRLLVIEHSYGIEGPTHLVR